MTQIIPVNGGGGNGGGGGSGDMKKSVYDPNNKNADAFDYNNFENTPSLATVATSGDYNDLDNLPTIPSVVDNLTSTSTTDALSANQGKTLKNMIDTYASGLNTKSFFLSGLSGASNLATAQEAYDRQQAGKEPILVYAGRTYILRATTSTQMVYVSVIEPTTTSANGYTDVRSVIIIFTISSGTVTDITQVNKDIKVLATGTNYSTPYTPEYDGSPANKKYVNNEDAKIISRGENLVTNGFATLGNSYNFSVVQFSGDDTYGAGGCFQHTYDRNFTPTTNEYMQVDITQTYKLSYAVKNSNTTATYDFLYMYDLDKNLINTGNVTRTANTTTTLAQDLNDGDTVVYLTDTTNWDTSDNQYRRGFIFWNYQNSFGYQYPVETYSRNWWFNLWADSSVAIDKVNNTITLSSPRNHGTFPAGTSLSQSAPSGGNIYGNANYTTTPGEWTYKEAFFTPDKFRTATSYIKIGWLLNYSKVENTTVKLSSVSLTQNVSFKDMGNTTVYTLASASDLSTAQKVYDEYQAGKNVAVQYSGNIFTVNNVSSLRMNFNGLKDGVTVNRAQGDTALQTTAMYFGLNSGTVTSINGPFNNAYIYTLSTAVDYDTPYTPLYNGSPATKKYVDDAVANLMAMGKFLSLWNCATGQPISFPLDTPYTYHTGDYFMVETVSTATPPVNYKPNGSSYSGTASSTTESGEVAQGDFYVYDGTVWLLATNHGKTVSFANLAGNPSDNTALSNALNAKQDTLTAGTGISVGLIQSDMQGPAPDGFHIPLNTEWQAVYDVWTALGGGSDDGTNFGIALKLPFAGFRSDQDSNADSQGSTGIYWSSSVDVSLGDTYDLYFSSSGIELYKDHRAYGFSVRCFKNSPTVPTSSWTKLYGTSIEAGGIFWNSTDGLISMSSDGSSWITIADKNLGATQVWNSGDTLSEANCGKYYQRGNNYGFPRTGSVTTSSAQVDASGYGPGNYYSSSTFIEWFGDWSSVQNDNLWGGVSKGTCGPIISNTGVTSVNGSTGDVTVQPTLVSGTNIKTINGSSVLGGGDITVDESVVSGDSGTTYTIKVANSDPSGESNTTITFVL